MGSSQSQAGTLKREKTAAEKAESAGKIINGVGNFLPGVPGALVRGAGGVIEGVSSLFTGDDDFKITDAQVNEVITQVPVAKSILDYRHLHTNSKSQSWKLLKAEK